MMKASWLQRQFEPDVHIGKPGEDQWLCAAIFDVRTRLFLRLSPAHAQIAMSGHERRAVCARYPWLCPALVSQSEHDNAAEKTASEKDGDA